MPVQITINGENAAEAIREFAVLSAAFTNKEVAAPQVKQPVTPMQQAPQAPVQQAPVQQAQPVTSAPTAVPTAQSVQQPTPQQQAPQPVPTTTATYTMDQLAVAATQLMDAGRQQELLGLLQSFGAQSLMQLPKKQYGNFATKLREMGAKI